jgi:hypothetical protein
VNVTSVAALTEFAEGLHNGAAGEFDPELPCWRFYWLPNYDQGPYVVGLFHHFYGDGESFYSRFKACSDDAPTETWHSTYNLAWAKAWVYGLLALPSTIYTSATTPFITNT